MNREEYEMEYQRIETGVAIGAMTWRTGMAKVALLSIDFGRTQAESEQRERQEKEPLKG